MTIEDNIIKYILKDTYFINGTAYAGKSTMIKLLAEKYDGICCGENYHLKLMDAVDKEHQPETYYQKNMKDWREFVSRTPEEYDRWYTRASEEIAGMELPLLIQYASLGKKIFVDTNISPSKLMEISEYDHVLIMLSPQETSVHRFFDREDAEKQFLYQELLRCDNPKKALENFRECLRRINSKEHYTEFRNSGFQVIDRDDNRSIEDTLKLVEEHFRLA